MTWRLHTSNRMTAQFRHDLTQEQLLQPHLDQCYAAHGIGAERTRAWLDQSHGIDVRLAKDGYRYAVDEKAQLHYIGKCLPTFALEVDLLVNGQVSPGWLFDERKHTEVYAFVFDITLHANETELHRAEQVAGVQIVLVNRERLIRRLAAEGLDRSMLSRLAKELRDTGTDRRSVHAPGVRVMLSQRLAEQPVNLLVTRRYLESIGQVLRSTASC